MEKKERIVIREISITCVILALLAGSIATITDIRKGIIPKKMTYPLVTIGVFLHLVEGFIEKNVEIAISGLVGFCIAFVFSYLLYLAGAWAGGDVMLMSVYGALIPQVKVIYEAGLRPLPSIIFRNFSFPIVFFINSIFGIFPFMFLYILYKTFKSETARKAVLKPLLDNRHYYLGGPIIITGTFCFLQFIGSLPTALRVIIGVIMIVLLFRVIPKVPAYIFSLTFILVSMMYFGTFSNTIKLLGLLYVVSIFLDFLNSVNKVVLTEEVKVYQLKEGMIPTETIYIKNGKVHTYSKGIFEELMDIIKKGKLFEADEVIASHRDAGGLEKEQIEKLKKLAKEKKIPSKIKVKRGMPFGPALFIGLLITLFLGDIFSFILLHSRV